jgi:GT2 family glycosyltransferase
VIFFATPTYRSDPNAALAWAARTVRALGIEGTKCKVLHGCPWLHTAYATLAAEFLASDGRMMMMRDDDVLPDPTTVGRMIATVLEGAPAVVAPYKVRDEERFDVVLEADGTFRWAGVGCMMVARRVIEELWIAHYEELHCTHQGTNLVCIFRDFFAERDDGMQLVHDDHAFWYRVRQAGFAVEVLDDVEVLHAGASMRYRKPAR